jgi:hypothetical protein
MSTLRANAIQTVAGKPILNSTGSVIQVVVSNTTGVGGEITTTSGSLVTTGLSVTITPTSSSSKLLVSFVGNGKFFNGGDDGGTQLRLYRDGVALQYANALMYRQDAINSTNHQTMAISDYVNANSTSSTTFTLYFFAGWGGTSVVSRDYSTNQFTVMEISA